ncbi:MAG: MBL fold metallo-hydrolase [Halobacteriales archaeon]
MKVTFLGTGSAMQSADRAQTGILVEGDDGDGDDSRVLIDVGAGVLHRLQEAASFEAVGHVLLTHHHLDHVSDLLPLLKARWLAGAESLSVAGPPGTEALVADLLSVHEYMQDRVDLTVRDLSPGEFEFGGFEVAARETRHSMPGYAYRIGDAFAFSGDSEAFPDLAAFADGCDVFAHDCSFPDEVDVSNHPTPDSLGRALAGVDVGTVVLTHLYPHTDGNHDGMRASIADHYDGAVRVGEDLQTVRI